MLTYRLVHPSFVLLKAADLFGANRLRVSISSGKLQPKDPPLLMRLWHGLIVAKILQLLVSLFRLVYFPYPNTNFIQSTLVVAAVTCLSVVGLNWSLALNRNIYDVVIVLSPLQNFPYSDIVGEWKIIWRQASEKGKNKCFLRKRIDKFINLCRKVLKYVKDFYAEFSRHRSTFTVHDILTIGVPLGVCSVLPIAYFCVIIGEPQDIFFHSLLPLRWEKLTALRYATAFLDIIMASYGVMTAELGFFILCATLAVYTRELENLDETIRSAQESLIPSRRMKGIWTEIRRLSIIINMCNYNAANSIFAGKVLAYTCSILGTFYIFRFGMMSLVSCELALLALQAIILYLLCMGNAYVITETMDNVLVNLKAMSEFYVGNSKRELKQRIRSVRSMVIKEANFGEMSNDTTPEFVDFYVNQFIALVLTF